MPRLWIARATALLAAMLVVVFEVSEAATPSEKNPPTAAENVDPAAVEESSASIAPSGTPEKSVPPPVVELSGEPAADESGGTTADELDELRKKLASQRDQLARQQKQLAAQQEKVLEQQKNIDAQTALLRSVQQQLDELAQAAGQPREPTPDELKMREQLAGLQEQLARIPEDPSASMAGKDFPGSIRIPGTDAAFKIGGFAKMNIVKSFDALGSHDRFIVGSIPVEAADAAIIGSDTDLTADQTRLNFEVRQKTSIGQFRSFVEGDFAGNEASYRLRHAYGQFRDVLAGRTWSVFYDPLAQPEEVDFEGINGIVNLRQAQVRYFPAIGKSWELAVSLEDPVSEVTEMNLAFDPTDPTSKPTVSAINDSELPDLAASVRHRWFGPLTLRSAIVLRRLSAISSFDSSIKGSTFGFGVNVGGSIGVTTWGEHDNLKFQLVYGRGIGRYVNDTKSVGGLDAVLNPNGNLKALPIWAANVAFQHWWRPTLRSTVLYSVVDIDTYGFQPDGAYAKTQRVSINLLWSPMPRIDVGGELLYGRRTNKDDKDGSAAQLQFQAKYRF